MDDTSVRENPVSVGRTPAGAAERPRLLLFRSNLGLDGGATRFLALASAARDRGGGATIVAPPGPLAERAAKAGALELVDWPSLPGLERLHVLGQAARGKSAVVTDCLPVNLSMVPALAANAPVHLCLHATPAALGEAFGDGSLRALGAVLKTLQRSGRVLLTAASEVEAREHERRLELGSGALVTFPHGLEHCADDDRPRTGPIRTVALVSRLERIKLPHVAAAAELVSAGRAAGAEVVLEVHGAGHAEREALALLAAALPASAFTMHGATSAPWAAMRGADVVVGGGRTCLEALLVGRRAVVGRAAPPEGAVSAPSGGHLGAPVTPATFDAHVADNFSSIGCPPARATDVWRALESLSARDIAGMQDRVRVEHSADAMLGRELSLLDELGRRPQRSELLLQAAAAYAADLETKGVHDAHRRAARERGRLTEVRSPQARRDRQLDRRLRAARTHLDKAAGSRAWRLSRRGALVLRRLRGERAALNDGLERARNHIDHVLAGQGEESGERPFN